MTTSYNYVNGDLTTSQVVQYPFVDVLGFIANGPGGVTNNGTPQTPQQPSKLKNALNCVTGALPGQLQANTSQLGTNLMYSFTSGPAIGVGACTAVVISEPYLAPSWPGCSLLAATSTTTIMASGSVLNWFIGNMASTVGTVYYCGKNELGGG